MSDNLIKEINGQYTDFLRDESRREGEAQSISFPETENDICKIVHSISQSGGTITTQGARTGIVAGAVPQGGHILNLSRMQCIGKIKTDESGKVTLKVEPGVILSDLQKETNSVGLFFPPDPTETSATIGGMVACNASGAKTFRYGPTRNWVEGVRLVLADGETLNLKRGANFAKGNSFELTTESGKIISGELPNYAIPQVKSAAGYYVKENMDLLDLFIGMEGTLGIISEIELKLIPKPLAVTALTLFMPDEESALKIVKKLRGYSENDIDLLTKPVAIEFFNADALNLLRESKEKSSAFANIPAIKPHYHTAIYVEFHGDDEEALEETIMQVMEAAVELGGNDEDTWYASNEKEIELQKAFRHATPEAVNLLLDERRRNIPQLTKLGTDMSTPDKHLENIMSIYNRDLDSAGLESVIFGHIGNNHVHVNIIPKTLDQYTIGKDMYLEWAQKVLEMGGSVSAEHGIGKLKNAFLKLMFGDEAITQMQNLRMIFDPANILNRGNLF